MQYFTVEHTDTFGGEANYSWVNHHTISSKTGKQADIVRQAKSVCGLTDVRHRTELEGEIIKITFSKINQVLFVSFNEEVS